MVVLASIFRDATDTIPRYFSQVLALQKELPTTVRLVIAEGDSEDDTFELLTHYCDNDDTLIKVDHGGPKYGSVDVTERWQNIAKVCNAVMDAAGRTNEPFIYVEQDLIWEPPTMLCLLERLNVVPAVAPLSLTSHPHRFYDVWGHRTLSDEPFGPWPPYHPDLHPTNMTEIGSAGSCFAVSAPLWWQVRFGDDDCIRGVGRSIREHEGSLWLDPSVAVYHP